MTQRPQTVVAPSSIVGVVEVGGRLCVHEQHLLVDDGGTGAGGPVAALGLDPAAAAALSGREVASGRVEPPHGSGPGGASTLSVALRPGTDGLVAAAVRGLGPAADVTYERPPADVADRLLGAITRQRLEAGGGACLHGGAVVGADGRAAVVLAWSGAGKSTLVAHLAHGGLDLVNDEQITVHPEHGVVSGFTRPVAVKPGGTRYLPREVADRWGLNDHTVLVSASELGTQHALTGVPVLVVLPERVDGAAPSWELLDPAAALEACAANNLDLVTDPVRGFAALGWLAVNARAVRVRYPDSASGATLVRQLLDDPPGPSTPPGATVRVTRAEPVAAGAAPRQPRARLRAVDGVVWVALGEQVLVFDPSSRRLRRLNHAAAGLWLGLPLDRWPASRVDRRFLADLVATGLVHEHAAEVGSPAGRAAVVALVDPEIGAETAQPSGESVLRVLGHAARLAGGPLELVVPHTDAMHGASTDREPLDRLVDALEIRARVVDARRLVRRGAGGPVRMPRWSRAGGGGPGADEPAGVGVEPRVLAVDPHQAGAALRLLADSGRATAIVVLDDGADTPAARPSRLLVAATARRRSVRILTSAPDRERVGRRWGVAAECVASIPLVGERKPVHERTADGVLLRDALGLAADAFVVVAVTGRTTALDLRVVLGTAAAVQEAEDAAGGTRRPGSVVHVVVLGSGPVLAGGRNRVPGPSAGVVHLVEQPDVVDAFLLGADVHLLSSDGRRGPQRVVEAMHAGLPTVAFGAGPGATFARDAGGSCWTPTLDVAALAATLVHLDRHADERRSLGDTALAVARREHTGAALERTAAWCLGDP